MKTLDDCLEETRKLKEINEQIAELKARTMSPKNQIITGMPRSGGGGNQNESYIVKLERLEARRDKIRARRAALWASIATACNDKKIKPEYISLLRHRFFKGLQWNKCCKLMCEEYPDSSWNMNKVFRVYRQILRKFS